MPADGTPDELALLRRELDAIDTRLRGAVRDRIDVVRRIAEYKRHSGVPMMQPHRIDEVQERTAAFAVENSIDVTFLRGLYEAIIAESCRLEDAIIAGAGDRTVP